MADTPILMGTGESRFSQPVNGKTLEYIKDSTGNFIPSGRTFGTNSEYFKRESNNFIDPSTPVARPLTIDRSIGKVASDNRNVARDQYQANWNQKSASNPNGWTSTQDKIAAQNPGGTWMTDTVGGAPRFVEFDSTSTDFGGYAATPTDGSISGQDKLKKYIDAGIMKEGKIIPSNAMSPYLKGYEDSKDLSKYGFTPSQPPQSPDPLAYAQWQASENERKANALEAKQAETVKDAKTLWANQANAQYQEQANKGYGEWEKEVLDDANSESNKVYSAAINPLNAERDAALAKMEASLQGMSPNQRRIYEGYRRNIIMSQYDKAVSELDKNYKENTQKEASSKYQAMQDKVMEMKTLTPEEQDKKLKEETIAKKATEIMEKWNTENPDKQINKWQAEDMAKDELFADPTKVDNIKALNELRLGAEDKTVNKFNKSVEITGGNVAEAKAFWSKYLPPKEVDKMAKTYFEDVMGFTPEQAEFKTAEIDIARILLDPEATVEQLENVDAYRLANPDSFGEMVWQIEYEKKNGTKPTVEEITKRRKQIQSDAATKKTGTGGTNDELTQIVVDKYLDSIKSEDDIIDGINVSSVKDAPAPAGVDPNVWAVIQEQKTAGNKVTFDKTEQKALLKAFRAKQAKSEPVKAGANANIGTTTKAGTTSSSSFDSLWESTK